MGVAVKGVALVRHCEKIVFIAGFEVLVSLARRSPEEENARGGPHMAPALSS